MNDGSAVEIKKHSEYDTYIPQLIFGELLTSSTFTEEKRITAGTHGLGAKLTNIFSKKFTVEIGDPINKKKYLQIFENNMQKINSPKITNYNDIVKYLNLLNKLDKPTHSQFVSENINTLIKESDNILRDLSWDHIQGREYLLREFNVSTRKELNEEQLLSFVEKLKSIRNQSQNH